MDITDWESLKDYIKQKMQHTKEGAVNCEILNVKNQMLTRVQTFEEVLSVMNTFEEYKKDGEK